MLKPINNDYAFSSIVFVFEPNTPFESPINWSNYYGLLASGTYRFDVEVYPLNGGDLEFAYAEFEIYT